MSETATEIVSPPGAWLRRSSDRLGVGGAEILSAANWKTLLEQFAQVTGLAATLFGSQCELLVGPLIATPFAKRLLRAGCWKEKGVCLVAEIEAARTCIETGAPVYRIEHGMLALFVVPLNFEGRCIGAIAAGWVFDSFPDPVPTNRLASHIKVPYLELWQIARQQPPVGQEKLKLCCGLLQTLADSFVKERAEMLKEQAQARDLFALNRSAQALAAASCPEEIGAAVVEASVALTRTQDARLLLSGKNNSWSVVAEYGLSDESQRLNGEKRAVTSRLRIPVEATDGTLLAVIEITEAQDFPAAKFQVQMSALAAQTAVALQKLQLIADLQRERERLERANKTKDEFLAVLSHEMRTPLTPILGWIALLNRSGSEIDAATLASGLGAIERNAQQELQLVDELLDLSRILSEKVTLEPELINPTDALASAFVNAQSLVAQRELHLKLDTDQNLPPISVDPKRLQQILSNLIANAVKFTPDGGAITIGARSVEKTVEFFITDTGVGMRREILDHIFDRFQQADSTTTRRFGGLGIGLSVVRGLVDLQGGTVWAESEGENRGSTFVVSFPIARVTKRLTDGRRKKRRVTDRNLADSPKRSGRVLVIDDSSDTLEILKIMIEAAGYEVETAVSVATALEIASRFTPNLIISDIGMPDADGFDFLKTLRENPTFVSVPVIALTGYAAPSDREMMLSAGFAAHLPKPVDATVLLATLDEVLLAEQQIVTSPAHISNPNN